MTDRCTVGCSHCSVNAQADSARVTDFALLEDLVDGLGAEPSFKAIAVTGGEPFSEARALSYVAERINESDKQLILYTSGVWANPARRPDWVRQVLGRTSCVVLGVDAYHAERMPEGRLVTAIEAVVEAGAWLVVQVISGGDGNRDGDARERDCAEALLARALGPNWPSYAEVNVVRALPYGRGADVFPDRAAAPLAGRELGRCALVGSPTVRFDGTVTACCDERVLAGAGPSGLRRRVRSRPQFASALAQLREDPYFRVLGRFGADALTRLPLFADLAQSPFRQVCGLCWRAVERVDGAAPDPMLLALSGAVS
ncbi:MAG: radical SAM protein [Actinocrinis sp.]